MRRILWATPSAAGRWLHFGVGVLGDARAIVRSRLAFLLTVGGFRDPILRPFRNTGPNNVCFVMLVVSRLRFLMVFASESGCPGLEN